MPSIMRYNPKSKFIPRHFWFPIFGALLIACGNTVEKTPEKDMESPKTLELNSSNRELVEAFNWAKEKALFYVQTGKEGKINVWERGEGTGDVAFIPSYWAGYPGRSAFYSRDFFHQAIGAHLLGLEKENFTMLKAFGASADEGKKWFPLWALNFDGSIYDLDYRGDTDFVREVPATFELVEKAYELYLWTGDDTYIQDEVLWNYYTKVVTDFIALHDTQLPNGVAEGTGKGIFQGAASYNEQRDAPLIESGDGIASQYKALEAYAQMAKARNEISVSEEYAKKAEALKTYFNEDWGIQNTQMFNRGFLANGSPVHGWGKENSWFMPMKGITEGGSERTLAYLDYIQERLDSKDDIPDNVEALSYLPETFFLHHQNERGWQWMDHIMKNLKQDHTYESATGKNGDYPEVSYVLVSNMIEDLMGLAPNAPENMLSTFSHLPEAIQMLEAKNIQIGKSNLSIKHEAEHTTHLTFQNGARPLVWQASFSGKHDVVYVNGVETTSQKGISNGIAYSFCLVDLKKGDSVKVSINPE